MTSLRASATQCIGCAIVLQCILGYIECTAIQTQHSNTLTKWRTRYRVHSMGWFRTHRDDLSIFRGNTKLEKDWACAKARLHLLGSLSSSKVDFQAAQPGKLTKRRPQRQSIKSRGTAQLIVRNTNLRVIIISML